MVTPESPKFSSAFGFNEVFIVPGEITVNPELVDSSVEIAKFKLKFPILAAAMDAVVDPEFAMAFSKLGGLAVLNLEGLQTRYEDPKLALEKIQNARNEESTQVIQAVYNNPIKEDLIAVRIGQIKAGGAIAAVACTPANAKRFGSIAKESGADIFVIQSTVTTARHISTSPIGLQIDKFVKDLDIPVIVGNTVSFTAAGELLEQGVAGILVGVGPGAACTSREVLGVGMPQISATLNCAAARDRFFEKTGKYIPIITDGGITNSGNICKSLAAGSDAVMLGSIFVSCQESPGRGYSWGMSTSNQALPRGVRIPVGLKTNLQRLLFGPTLATDGTENLVGAIKMAMGMCGAQNLSEFQMAQLVTASGEKLVGKIYQKI